MDVHGVNSASQLSPADQIKFFRRARRELTLNAIRLLVPGLLLGVAASIVQIDDTAISPLHWFRFRGLSPADAMTWNGFLAGSVFAAFGLVLAIGPRPKPRDPLHEVYDQAGILRTLRVVTMACSVLAVAIAVKALVPTSDDAAVLARLMPAATALLTVLMTMALLPRTHSDLLITRGLRQREAALLRRQESISNLRSVVGSRLVKRSSRCLAYLLWGLGCGVLAFTTFAIPRLLDHGWKYFAGWKNGLAALLLILFFAAGAVSGLAYLGLGVRARWRVGGWGWHALSTATVAAGAIGIVALIAWGAFSASSLHTFVEASLLILVVLGLPYAAIVLVFAAGRGFGAVVLATALHSWEKEAERLSKEVESVREGLRLRQKETPSELLIG